MKKVSNIISSYVVSVYDGQIEGIVSNILFNNKKRAKYLIISQNDEQFWVLDTKDIFKLGEGSVLIKNSNVLNLLESMELKTKECFSPINSIIVSIDGNLLGHVADIELDKKFNITQFISSKNEAITLNKTINISDTVIVCCNSENRPRLSRFKQKQTILIPESESSFEAVNILEKNETILPNRTVVNYNFLVNRKVTKNILNFNGEIIIKENQIINSKILDIARINGKIRELTKYSM